MTEYIADVSEFQETIDWPAYGAQNHGVIVRAHNGNRPDNSWVRNRDGARANVLWRGLYQYLPASVDPVAAARAFQATTGPLLPGEVAILDLEEGTGDQRGRRQAWLDTLQDDIEWTYSGLAFARAHLPGVRIEWLAAYGQGEPTDAHDLWQFTNARTFAGIAKPCDASIFHGTIQPGLSGGIGRSIGGGTPVLTPATTTQEDDMFSDQDRATLTALYGWVQGLQPTLAADVPFIKAQIDALQVADTRTRLGQVQYTLGVLLARDPATITATDLAAAIPTDIAQQVADELAKRLAS